MGMTFTKATKKKAKLRCAIFGPSGSGKTFTALRIATGMIDRMKESDEKAASDNARRIAYIDSERGSASKYSDRFDFDVVDLEQKTIDAYVYAINEAAKYGYGMLIIDSLTHAWQELLEEIDMIAKSKYGGNSWAAWSDGTPKQRKLVNAILGFKGHIIATMRSKTEWITETNNSGKMTPKRVGLAPEQGKGIEYEFDLLLEITTEHVGSVIKDRTGKFQDKMIEKPGEDFGEELIAWLNDGEAAPEKDYSVVPKSKSGKWDGKKWTEVTTDQGTPDYDLLEKTIKHYESKGDEDSVSYAIAIRAAIDELKAAESEDSLEDSLEGSHAIEEATESDILTDENGNLDDPFVAQSEEDKTLFDTPKASTKKTQKAK